MPLDPSISLQAGAGQPEPLNMLQTAGQMAQLANTAAQNRMINTSADQAAQGLAVKNRNALGSMVAGFLSLPQDPKVLSDNDYGNIIQNGIQNGVKNGLFDQKTAQGWLDGIGQSKDRSHINDMMLSEVFKNLDPSGQVAGILGTIVNRPNGAVDQYGVQNPLRAFQGGAGFVPNGQGVVQQLPPGTAADMISVPNGDGTSTSMTRAAAAQKGGLSGIVSPLQFGNNGGRYPVPQGGAPPTQPQAQPSQPTQSAPIPTNPSLLKPATGQPVGTLGTTQSPAATTAQIGNATAGIQMGSDLIKAADDLPNQRSMLDEMDSALDHIPTGKGQSNIQEYKSWIQSLSPQVAKMLGIDPQNIATGDTFKKLANNLALRQAQSLGMGTDQSRASVFGGNPNFDISTLGNKQIIQILKGNADALQAKANAWRNSPQFSTGDYSGFSTSFNKSFDPRAYQFHYMDNDARNMLKASAVANGTWSALRGKIEQAEAGG